MYYHIKVDSFYFDPYLGCIRGFKIKVVIAQTLHDSQDTSPITLSKKKWEFLKFCVFCKFVPFLDLATFESGCSNRMGIFAIYLRATGQIFSFIAIFYILEKLTYVLCCIIDLPAIYD